MHQVDPAPGSSPSHLLAVGCCRSCPPPPPKTSSQSSRTSRSTRSSASCQRTNPQQADPDRVGFPRFGVGGRREHRSVSQSFHPALLGPTGAYWLDDPSDLSCKDSTRQYVMDGSLLSCKQQVGGSS